MRNFTTALFIILSTLFFISCDKKIDKKDAWNIGLSPCAARPPYAAQCPVNGPYAALSTSERTLKGLVLVDIQTKQTWQHPSWSTFGSMGPICTDKSGNSYVAPVPVINVLDNSPETQNHIYTVNGQTALMTKLMELPFQHLPNEQNPYGLVGLHYDCHADILFASSILGSDKTNENGVIFIIDPIKKVVLDKLESVDAMGMAIAGVTGQKRLYFGSCRISNVYSIEISAENTFIGEPKFEFSLDMLGPRGDDKARKLIFKEDGTLLIKGISFEYNLAAPTEKLETNYLFQYDRSKQTWTYLN